MQISDATVREAHGLLKQNLDAKYVHVYIHCIEKFKVLYNTKIIHGDVKPDNFLNCASVVLDFGRS
jgi:serine/threonine protein kinase